MQVKGFTYLEILIALVIFQLVTVVILQGQLRARQQVLLAQQELVATAFLVDIASVLQQAHLGSQQVLTLTAPYAERLDCLSHPCSSSQQIKSALDPVLSDVFATFSDAQICIEGSYPKLNLNLNWRSSMGSARHVGLGTCLRSGAYHQVQINGFNQ